MSTSLFRSVRAPGVHPVSSGQRTTRRSCRGASVQVRAAEELVSPTGTQEEIDAKMWKQTFKFDINFPGQKPLTQELTCSYDKKLVCVTVGRPLGIAFEERILPGLEGMKKDSEIYVAEVFEDSNASKEDVQVGDVLRATSAVFKIRPPLDILGYYANPPSEMNARGVYVPAGNFNKAMDAIVSNGQPVELPDDPEFVAQEVALILERDA